MICTFIIISYILILYILSFLFLKKRYDPRKEKTFVSYLKSEFKFLVLSVVVLISVSVVVGLYTYDKDLDALSRVLKWVTLYMGLWLLSKTDFKEKKIPNMIILILFGIRVIFLIYEILSDMELSDTIILYPLIGGAVGAVIMIVAMIVSRKGVGMGDVKMFLIIGLYVGGTDIIPVMFYTFFISAIVGIILICTRKAKLKDSVPMAPFAFLGMATQFFMLMLGGYT